MSCTPVQCTATIFRELFTKYIHPPTKHGMGYLSSTWQSVSLTNPPLAIRPVLREWSEGSGSWVRITVKMVGGQTRKIRVGWAGCVEGWTKYL
jgi:hypothetical protein